VKDTGTGTGNVVLGNDSRLSDSRTPADGSVTSAKLASGLSGLLWRPVDVDVAMFAPTGTQNTWVLTPNSSAPFAIYRGNTAAAAVNDYLEWSNVYIPAGTWTVAVACFRGNTTAIATVSIDGSSVGTVDTYNASPLGDVLSITGVSIAEGLHTVRVTAATKNAAGTATYLLRLSRLSFRRTA